MQRIQNISTYLTWVFNALLIILPLNILAGWFFIEWEPYRTLVNVSGIWGSILTPEGAVSLASLTLSPLSKLIGLGSSVIGVAPLFCGLLVLKKLFQNYKNGLIFSQQNAEKYKMLAGLFLLNAILAMPLSQMLEVLAVTLSNPPGHRWISLTFGSPNLEVVFCGVLVLCISWIMVEAYRLKEDQNLTI